MPLNGTSVYEISKICAERICQSYALNHAVRVAMARCSNIFGGGDIDVTRLVPNHRGIPVTAGEPAS